MLAELPPVVKQMNGHTDLEDMTVKVFLPIL